MNPPVRTHLYRGTQNWVGTLWPGYRIDLFNVPSQIDWYTVGNGFPPYLPGTLLGGGTFYGYDGPKNLFLIPHTDMDIDISQGWWWQ